MINKTERLIKERVIINNMAETRSVSLSKEEADFIDEYNLSPTTLIKNQISTMNGYHKTVFSKKIEQLETNIAKMQRRITWMSEFIEKKGLLLEFGAMEEKNLEVLNVLEQETPSK